MSRFADLPALEDHLKTRSYIDGYTPTQADVGVYSSLGTAPDAKEYPHAARWYTHIKSYEAEHAGLPGDKATSSKLFGGVAGATTTDSAAAAEPAGEEDEIDLFGDDDDEEVDEEAEKIKQERLKAYEEKKKGKAKPAAKSLVTLDVKPWDDETDMVELEKAVRSIEQPGLLWGASKLVAIGYGIKKLQITLVIEDELVGLDDLQEKIAADFEDYVQSTDIQAMQKL